MVIVFQRVVCWLAEFVSWRVGWGGEDCLLRCIFRPTSHLLDRWVNISVAESQNVHFRSWWVIFCVQWTWRTKFNYRKINNIDTFLKLYPVPSTAPTSMKILQFYPPSLVPARTLKALFLSAMTCQAFLNLQNLALILPVVKSPSRTLGKVPLLWPPLPPVITNQSP